MSEKRLWCGYLEAGDKSTPVLLDSALDTGDPKTVYLFNHVRGRILEYRRSIVEPKLRELKGKERGSVADLTAAYAEAVRVFKPRSLPIPEASEPVRPAQESAEGVEMEDLSTSMDTGTETGDVD
jgi:hypothetical protein